ncbi:MAG: hypothetical protein ABJA74_09945 [Lapillicoccus sp.]
MRAAGVAAVALCCAGALSACADRDPEPAATTPPTATSGAAAASPTTAATGTLGPATGPTAEPGTALPGMPVPLSSGPSPVDPAKLRSIDDLPSVFQCPSAVSPLRIPPSPAVTGATAPPAPEAVVCASALADQEAVYLWYTPTPEAKLGALTEALAKTKYVHAGPTWVAAGMLNPTMGTIGGEVYR